MKLTIETEVAAPIERVFEAMTDLRNAPARCSGIKSLELLTEGPVGAGTRFRETREMFGKEAVEEMEVTAFTPPSSYTVEGDSCGAHFTSTFTFTPHGDGTRVVMQMTSRANTVMAKLMTPVGWLFRGVMKKAIRKDLDDLKAYVEG